MQIEATGWKFLSKTYLKLAVFYTICQNESAKVRFVYNLVF